MSILSKCGLTLTALAALGLAAAHPAAAQTTIYNFEVKTGGSGDGGYTAFNGIGALGGGTTWNQLTQGTPTVTNAKSSTGTASTVGLTIGTNGNYTGRNDGISTNPDALLSAYLNANGGATEDIEFTGLTASAPYTLDLYGINGGSTSGFNNRTTTFTLTASNYTTAISAVTTTAGQDTTFNNPNNYVQFTGTTDASGDVYATYKGSNTSEGDFNGAQISQTISASPEPSAWAGLGLTASGIGGLVLKARKREQTEMAA